MFLNAFNILLLFLLLPLDSTPSPHFPSLIYGVCGVITIFVKPYIDVVRPSVCLLFVRQLLCATTNEDFRVAFLFFVFMWMVLLLLLSVAAAAAVMFPFVVREEKVKVHSIKLVMLYKDNLP